MIELLSDKFGDTDDADEMDDDVLDVDMDERTGVNVVVVVDESDMFT